MPSLKQLSTRTKIVAGTALVAATALTVAGIGAASATPNPPNPPGSAKLEKAVPGDNGTVKVHRSTTPADDRRNEPHVCEFYLVGFNFDAGQDVSWQIRSWPPTGDRTVVSKGALELGDDGHGRTKDMSLPDGHYKLFWKFAGEHGKAKHKVFWVQCTDRPTTTPPPSESPSTPPMAPAPEPVEGDFPVTG
ncbi:MAG: hypothetical protein GEV11_26400 [Streptosporangiales bacterium]|nr:hypothetical protein [Streptosporangiales bacterium]